jgi:pimeloyl-ACP methyl ester carboxylesterase
VPHLRFRAVLTIVGLVLAGAAHAADSPAKSLPGVWLGPLKVGAVELRQGVTIKAGSDGKFTGTISSLDQDAKEYPLDVVELKDKAVRLELTLSKAVFEGTLSDDGKEIAGKWLQGGLNLPLTFKKVDALPTAKRPQTPKKPYPYDEHDVTFENTGANVKLAGTLSVPRGAGPHPAAILISGSGGQDRDETIFNHKPFLVLADYLTRRGIAVLRYDDRGMGKSTGNLATATTEDLAGDTAAGLAFLKTRKDIDPKRIGLIGHSEGGIIAPLLASRSNDVAFIVMLAGPGLPGEDILYLQGQTGLKLAGAMEAQLTRQRKLQEKLFAVLKKEPDNDKVAKLARAEFDALLADLPEAEKKEAEAMKGQVEAQVKMLASPWMRFFILHDPRPALKQVRCPVLALIGEKDFQVPPKENAAEIKKAFEAGGNKDATVQELPHLNHLFQTSKTGALSEYGQLEETFAPAALELIGDWVVKRMGVGK